MTCNARFLVSLGCALALVAETVAPAFAARELTRADYDACQARDETAFRAAIETITIAALNKGLSDVDYKTAVADEWRKGGLDEIVDQRVDAAITEVQNETSTGDRLRSIVNAETAKALAEKVAERVYRSDQLKTAIEGLAAGVGREVGKRIELASQDAAEPAMACLKAFLGPRYGTAIARAVAQDAGREFGLDPARGGADVGAGTVLKQSGEGIAGAAILLVRRQLANMSARVGQRLVGSVLSRLVSVAAGGVGLVLIAKDLWELSGGVFPIIAKEMKSRETKDKVAEELAKTIAEQIGEHVKEIGAKSADRVVEIWQEFRRAHLKVLELTERNEPFKVYVDKLNADALPRLDEVTGLLLAAEGEAGVLKRLGDGTLDEAVARLSPPGMEIARETRSIATALAWSGLAGPDLAKVVELEIHRRTSPDQFSKASLAKTLALGDRLAVTRVAGLKRDARDLLFELGAGELKTLARSLTETELDTLARYLGGLQKEPRDMVMRAIAQNPQRMQLIGNERVRDGILASRDQTAAVAMMLRSDPMFQPAALMGDVRAVWDGKISPVLLYEKHPSSLYAAAGVLLVLLLMLRRLLRPRRARAVTSA